MSTAERGDRRMTPAEYAVWELEQVERHEYYAGEVFSQAGGTRRHSLIGSNAVRAIGNLLIGHACQAHGSDMRVRIEATGYEAYPDVSVVCPPFARDSEDVITNPIWLVEVLPRTTLSFATFLRLAPTHPDTFYLLTPFLLSRSGFWLGTHTNCISTDFLESN